MAKSQPEDLHCIQAGKDLPGKPIKGQGFLPAARARRRAQVVSLWAAAGGFRPAGAGLATPAAPQQPPVAGTPVWGRPGCRGGAAGRRRRVWGGFGSAAARGTTSEAQER